MSDLPPLDDSQKLKLTEMHRLVVETHAAVIRLESSHSGNMEVLRNIEKHTGTVAQFFEQLDTVTKLAAGKNQIPLSLVIVVLVLGTAYAISSNIKDSGQNFSIPWLGIYITNNDKQAERDK